MRSYSSLYGLNCYLAERYKIIQPAGQRFFVSVYLFLFIFYFACLPCLYISE